MSLCFEPRARRTVGFEMSRIGRLPVAVPSGVDVTIDGQQVTVTGPKGTLRHIVAEPISVRRGDDGALEVTRPDDERESKALHGLSRTLIANMVTGVTPGTRRRSRSWARVTGSRRAATIWSSRWATPIPVLVRAPEGITFRVEAPTRFAVEGIDKQKVGEVAANIRKLRKPDPYKGKGVRYQGEVVRRKAGKTGK